MKKYSTIYESLVYMICTLFIMSLGFYINNHYFNSNFISANIFILISSYSSITIAGTINYSIFRKKVLFSKYILLIINTIAVIALLPICYYTDIYLYTYSVIIINAAFLSKNYFSSIASNQTSVK